MPDQSLLVYVTIPADGAMALCRRMVEEGLAACANIIPSVQSVYRWQGTLCEDAEALCLFKTSRSRYPDLEARILHLHPYETPCVVALPLAAGSAAFCRWIHEETA